MFNFAQNIEMSDYKASTKVVDSSHMSFEDGKETGIVFLKQLDVSISGKIDEKKYGLHFIITKPIEEYLNIEKYKQVEIGFEKITDLYLTEDNIADMSLEIKDMKVLRFNNELIFSFYYFESTYRYFGNVEFEVDVELIEKNINK